ncbi:hypothetical protein M2271_002819 [Streptomyces sp. LBL]|nr:hypothetical protein [Streptomyces sp. LBL]
MFNRIRRTLSCVSARYRPKGRHRRAANPARTLAAAPAFACGAPLLLRRHREHMGALMGEETALVRPYVLASEEHVRHRSTAPLCPPFAGPWLASVGDR